MISTNNEEKPSICTIDDFRSLNEKKKRILCISTDEKKRGFAQKFSDSNKMKDLEILSYRTDSSCEVVNDLKLKDKPVAVLIENGEIKNRIELTNDDVKDTTDLTRMIFKEKNANSCNAYLAANSKGWSITPDSSKQCNEVLSKIDNQGPAVKRHFRKHIKRDT